jgi:hypothetical protein
MRFQLAIFPSRNREAYGSEQISLGAHTPGAPKNRRSSASNTPQKEFESPKAIDLKSDLSAFLSSLRFEKRNLMAELRLALAEIESA